jgi:hypothetical protein
LGGQFPEPALDAVDGIGALLDAGEHQSTFEAGEAELGDFRGFTAAVAVGDERVGEDRAPVVEDLTGDFAQGLVVVGLLGDGADGARSGERTADWDEA